MAFPSIVTDRPIGTQMVSTIDDFERETRTWLEQCMREISGYPDVGTISVCGWTNSTRPSSAPSGKYLLGYNSQSNSLELVGSNGTLANITKQFALASHPVGEYYYTSNPDFNPNTYWGGTWEKMQDNRVLISSSSRYPVDSIGGTEKETLSIEQIPTHYHRHSHNHSHLRGTMNITGSFGLDDREVSSVGGAFVRGDRSSSLGSGGTGNGYICEFDASRSWNGQTSVDSTVSGSPEGGGQSHNNMQPYRVAICWHRVA